MGHCCRYPGKLRDGVIDNGSYWLKLGVNMQHGGVGTLVEVRVHGEVDDTICIYLEFII